MVKQLWRRACALFVLAGLFAGGGGIFTGCVPFSPAGEPTAATPGAVDTPEEENPAEEVVTGLSLFVSADALPATFDPLLCDSTLEYTLAAHLFQGLYAWRAQENETRLVPAAAKGYELSVSAEGTATYTFYLQQDALWSDGVAVTAGDFEYAWKRLAETTAGTGHPGLLYGIENADAISHGELPANTLGIIAIDDYTLSITLMAEDPAFLARTSQPSLYPVRQDAVERAEYDWSLREALFCSNGPYTLAARDAAQITLRSREEEYDGPGQITLGLEADGDKSAHVSLTSRGEGAGLASGWEYYLSLSGADLADTATETLLHAFTLALDTGALAVLDASILPAQSAEPFDAEAAQGLLAEAGWPDGAGWPEGVLLLTANDKCSETLGAAMTESWRRALGVDVELRTEPPHDSSAHPIILTLRRTSATSAPAGDKPLLTEQFRFAVDPSLRGLVVLEGGGLYFGGCQLSDSAVYN